MPDLTRPERKGGKTRRRMASERQINRLRRLLAVKMISQCISFNNRLTHQSTTLASKRRQLRTWAEHRRLKSGLPILRGADIHKNIPVSGTKLTLGLRIGCISFHLTADNSSKLTRERSRVHRRWASTLSPKLLNKGVYVDWLSN